MTGNVLPADVTFFKRHGADEVLGKPLEFDLLRRTWAMTDITRRPPADAGTGTSSDSNGMHPSNSKAAGSEISGDGLVASAALTGGIPGTRMSGPGSPAQLRQSHDSIVHCNADSATIGDRSDGGYRPAPAVAPHLDPYAVPGPEAGVSACSGCAGTANSEVRYDYSRRSHATSLADRAKNIPSGQPAKQGCFLNTADAAEYAVDVDDVV